MDKIKIKSSNQNFFEGPFIFTPKRFFDERGFFYESWNKKIFDQFCKKNINFVQENNSCSFLGVLRGLHFQTDPFAQGKLVKVIKGEIYDVIVDLREKSKTFAEWALIKMSKKNRKQLWVPKGFAHGFITRTKTAEIQYKVTSFWNKNSEKTILWNDKDLNINWELDSLKCDNPIISQKDSEGSSLRFLQEHKALFS